MWCDKQDAALDDLDKQIPSHLRMKPPALASNENRESANIRPDIGLKSDTGNEEIQLFKTCLAALSEFKNQANVEYKKGSYGAACECYDKLVKTFEAENWEPVKDQPIAKQAFELYVSALSNSSQAQLNMKNYDLAIGVGKKAISVQPGHTKSYYRVAKALRQDY